MKIKFVIILVSFLLCNVSLAQFDEKDLIGTWELAKSESYFEVVELKNIENRDLSNKDVKIDTRIFLQFDKNNNLDINQNEVLSRVKYKLKDSLLIMGWRKYKVLKLSNIELILQDYEDIFSVKDIYLKTNNKIQKVKEFEVVEQKYTNGQLKLKGTLHNGFENGVWIEWHENGQKKSERLFINGIPYGIWKEWDEEGKLIRKTNMN